MFFLINFFSPSEIVVPILNFIGCFMVTISALPWMIPYTGSIAALIIGSAISIGLFLIGHNLWKKYRILKFDRKISQMYVFFRYEFFKIKKISFFSNFWVFF